MSELRSSSCIMFILKKKWVIYRSLISYSVPGHKSLAFRVGNGQMVICPWIHIIIEQNRKICGRESSVGHNPIWDWHGYFHEKNWSQIHGVWIVRYNSHAAFQYNVEKTDIIILATFKSSQIFKLYDCNFFYIDKTLIIIII